MIQCEYFDWNIHSRCKSEAKRLIVMADTDEEYCYECEKGNDVATCLVVCDAHAETARNTRGKAFPVVLECGIPRGLYGKGGHDDSV